MPEFFSLNFQRPEFLWLLTLAAPLLLIHWLRARPRRLVVPDLATWEDFLSHAGGRGRPSRLQEILSLLARLVLLIAVVMAAAGAYLGPASLPPPGVSLAIVIDTSPSMGAIDVPGHAVRLDAARALAVDLIENRLDPSDRWCLLSTGGLVVGRSEPTSVRLATLHGLTIEHGVRHNVAGAVKLASQLVGGAEKPRILVIGDGGGEGAMERARMAVPDVVHVGVGSSDANVAILDLQAIERLETGAPRFSTSVANLGSEAVEVELRGVGEESLRIELGANSASTVTFDAPALESALILEAVSSSDDHYPDDDRAYAGIVPAQPQAVLVAATEDADASWLTAALAALGPLIDRSRSLRTTPAGLPAATASDSLPDLLIVAGGRMPEGAAAESVMLLGADAPWLGVEATGTLREAMVWENSTNHPLLAGVSFAELLADEALELQLDAAFEVLASDAVGRPLVAVRHLAGGRTVVAVAMRPAATNLGQLASFPLLLRNALLLAFDYRETTVEGVHRAGDVIRSRRPVLAERPVPARIFWDLEEPDKARRLAPVTVVDGDFQFDDTRRPGLYGFEFEGRTRYAGVNRAPDLRESRIAVTPGGGALEDVFIGIERGKERRSLFVPLVYAALAAFLLDAVFFAFGRRQRAA